MNSINKEAKNWLQLKRKSSKITQEQMAKKLGISLTAYRDMETGKTIIVNPTFLKAAETIDADPKEIFGNQSICIIKESLTNLIDALSIILKKIEE